MAREIDVDALEIDDVTYLKQRPWLIEEARLQGVDDIDTRIEEVLSAEEARKAANPYDDLSHDELKDLAAGQGLAVTGTKKAIIARLKKHSSETEVEPEPDTNADGSLTETTG